MNISLAWLNSMLSPGDLTAAQAEQVLTFVGFPIESATPLASGDTLLDVEVTSNRGDCLSHVGVAREVAAATGRALVLPHKHVEMDPATVKSGGIGGMVSLENRVAGAMGVGGCPLFTLRLISGVRVGPSPEWMVKRLEAIGQRSINNVVDCTNYVLFELGSPSHVFDMAKLRPVGGWGGTSGVGGKPAVIVRGAEKGEKLKLLDGKEVELRAGELVVADGERATSLAGIMGGAESAVSEHTTDVLLEVATWSPGPIRACARRLQLRSDSSYRFERRVDARTVEAASRRVAELIVQTAGGMLISGVLHAGEPIVQPPAIAFRPARCRAVLGASFSDDQMRTALTAQGVTIGVPRTSGASLVQEEWPCAAPAHRPDVNIEEDLIEEVARTIGLDKIPVKERLEVRVAPPQSSERAVAELSRVLTGLGFFETVTFSFARQKDVKPFLPAGISTVGVSDDRRGDEGTLRTSLVPSLLGCRRANLHAKSALAGALRLFELASVYYETRPGEHRQHRNLGLLLDAPAEGSAIERKQAGLRLMRGTIEQVIGAMHGSGATLRVVPGFNRVTGIDHQASAAVFLGDTEIGFFGLVADATQRQFEIEHPVIACELLLDHVLAGYPPRASVAALPTFPATDRDLSLVVDEHLPWAKIESSLRGASARWMESLNFVYTYRGKPLAEGKKSVTLRMVFREGTRTLQDAEVNAEMDKLIALAGRELGATVRV